MKILLSILVKYSSKKEEEEEKAIRTNQFCVVYDDEIL